MPIHPKFQAVAIPIGSRYLGALRSIRTGQLLLRCHNDDPTAILAMERAERELNYGRRQPNK